MRLLTHNTLQNNAAAAKGKGFPLQLFAGKVRVDDHNTSLDATRQLEFVKKMLPTLDWPALVRAASQVGIPTLPPILTEDLAQDEQFLGALFHILMNVHVVEGTLTCPVTGREFPIIDEIPNMLLEEEECERVRF